MNLAKTQVLSLFTKGITATLGIIQSVIVIRILSPAEFGLVGLVMSVGGVIGVSQHLGIVDGAIREIAVLKKKREIGKVFWVSHLVRQAATIPLSVGLLLLAGVIAGGIYGRPEIALYLQIFAAVLILQGLQDVLGAALTGMKKFVSLYVVQVITALINVAAFAYLTWRFGVVGFFWAIIFTTLIMVILYFAIVVRELRGNIAWPSVADIRKYTWRVMRIGAFMYLARIFFIVWQRLPILALGGVLAAKELGYLNVSQTFGSKLTIIAMALSEVNLSWMSSLYTHKREEFKKAITRNMQRVLVLMILLALVLLFFTTEILQYIIGSEYLPAQPLILIMTLGFFLYALTDIGTSSVFVPADQPKLRAITYALMTGITGLVIAFLLWWRPDPLLAAYAVLSGALASYVMMVVIARKKFGVNFLTPWLMGFMVALGVSVLWLMNEPKLAWRLAVFILWVGLVWWEAKRNSLIPNLKDIAYQLRRNKKGPAGRKINHRISSNSKVVCFAGAEYDALTWTNRQQIMSRVAKRYPVLYVEPRVWIARYIVRNLIAPGKIIKFLGRLLWVDKKDRQLYVISQWNLIPWSREVELIGTVNHWLNRFCVMLKARWLGFKPGERVMWIYDTEAAQYLSSFKQDAVLYDCVDDHAEQAGVNRNPERVKAEEEKILNRANLVTVTSRALLKKKSGRSNNVKLVLNAGDVELFSQNSKGEADELKNIRHPIIGSVGTLDEYKYDFDLLYRTATKRKDWNFVFIGSTQVDQRSVKLKKLQSLKNVYLLGAKSRLEVPKYVRYFDVCIIPYRSNRYNASSFPLKFWEFMATGKPIVVTGLPELKIYDDLISYAKREREFSKKIAKGVKHCSMGAQRRRAEAKKHTWGKRTGALLLLMKQL